MKITQTTDLLLAGAQQSSQSQQTRLVRQAAGGGQGTSAGLTRMSLATRMEEATVSLSAAGRRASAAGANGAGGISDVSGRSGGRGLNGANDANGATGASGTTGSISGTTDADAAGGVTGDEVMDRHLSLLQQMLEHMLGHKIRVYDPQAAKEAKASDDLPEAPPADSGARAGRLVRHESYQESETTRFSATGTVQTADGRQIDFSLNLTLSRSFSLEIDTVLAPEAPRKAKDPLMIGFAGPAAELSEVRFSFDLDADGTAENINRPGAGSGFLALDRNGDGQINNGSELFGTRSGDGFADLARLDGDGNGWIDENDAAFGQLSVWQPGSSLQSLAEAGVGALSLSRVATPFSLRDAANNALGEVRASGFYLREDGQAGSLQQVDLSV